MMDLEETKVSQWKEFTTVDFLTQISYTDFIGSL